MSVSPIIKPPGLPAAPARYDPSNEDQTRAAIAREIAAAERRARGPQQYLVMVSPDGTRWRVSVSNAGAWVIAAD